MPTVIKGQPPSTEIRQKLADLNEPVGLAFSCGKDSIAAWLAMKEAGIKEIVPVYWWTIPDLSFVNESLKYYEDVFETHIFRLPHPSFYRFLAYGVCQPPERIRVIEAANIIIPTYEQIWDLLIEQEGLPKRMWKANGTRAADSLMRRTSFMRHGVMKEKTRVVSPIADWLKSEVFDIMKRHNVKLPVDYEMFKRSFDGIDSRYVIPIKERFPDDYEKLLEWFPLIKMNLIRGGISPDDV